MVESGEELLTAEDSFDRLRTSPSTSSGQAAKDVEVTRAMKTMDIDSLRVLRGEEVLDFFTPSLLRTGSGGGRPALRSLAVVRGRWCFPVP
jgi:hypothetical protein